ncbi:hypothetical protein D9M68_977380 [compost metagenome]
MTHSEESELAEIAEQLAWDFSRDLPGIGARNDALADKTAHLLAHHAQVFVEKVGLQKFEFGHGSGCSEGFSSKNKRAHQLIVRHVGLF